MVQWNDILEQTIKEIGETCQGYKFMHLSNAEHTNTKFNRLMYISILLPPLASLFGTISTITDNKTVNIFSIMCGILGGIFVTIVKYGKYQQGVVAHKNTAAKYSSLEANIRRQLSLYRNDRINAGKYINWVSTAFDELFSSSPLISSKIHEQWLKIASNNNIVFGVAHTEADLNIHKDTKNKIYNLHDLSNININKLNIYTNENNQETISESETEKSVQKDIDENKKDNLPPDINIKIDNATEEIDKGPTQNNSYKSYPEFNKFDDNKMRYELERLYGHT